VLIVNTSRIIILYQH